MKKLLIIPFLILFACAKHESKETTDSYHELQIKADSYVAQMEGLSIDVLFPDRCDRLIFISLSSSYSKFFDLSSYEWQPGEWHRDVVACYPDDSKSEISFDGLIGVLTYFWTYKDFDGMVHLKDYGAEHNYKFGEGPKDLTVLPQVGILLLDMLEERNLTKSGLNLEGTHNEHLLSLTFWLKLDIDGYLNDAEKLGLESVKDNKIKEALLNRITDGNQEKIIEYLSSFPDELPLETGWESWGGMPAWLYWFLLKAVIDGK